MVYSKSKQTQRHKTKVLPPGHLLQIHILLHEFMLNFQNDPGYGFNYVYLHYTLLYPNLSQVHDRGPRIRLVPKRALRLETSPSRTSILCFLPRNLLVFIQLFLSLDFIDYMNNYLATNTVLCKVKCFIFFSCQ